jgi:hypothetical protein
MFVGLSVTKKVTNEQLPVFCSGEIVDGKSL